MAVCGVRIYFSLVFRALPDRVRGAFFSYCWGALATIEPSIEPSDCIAPNTQNLNPKPLNPERSTRTEASPKRFCRGACRGRAVQPLRGGVRKSRSEDDRKDSMGFRVSGVLWFGGLGFRGSGVASRVWGSGLGIAARGGGSALLQV